ncbi:CoB--CoM heterodisulfide reductase iron-sulfur subunit B family protein [Thermodesulforhabdus norvegica]|uniref:Heterodisulfide reductase subunit B n=1 Tax=Thermodesulforhabdus norvegica TaxID=39841 RepID=A0A1I4SJB7_9BACT|nr:CoB--CoM heterodisulfide reductase iron-sulfur subunit B family protein [Thermodesulforhabdus norvegica]SFM64363.1 heterodisulfide reductase subunit B [Thermodesulforhabdus norvegica]
MIRSLSFYPGCSLEGTARDYRKSIEKAFRHLGISLEELENWTCCGASAAHSLDRELAFRLSAFNLVIAEKAGRDLLVPCALCFHNLKSAEKKILGSEDLAKHYGYSGSIRVYDIASFLALPEVLEKIRRLVTRPIKGLRAVCYYGCLTARPPSITDCPEPENPSSLERVLSVLEAEPVEWPQKTDCCGAGHAVPRPELVETLVKHLYDAAVAWGADCIVVSCQMCQANLDMFQENLTRKSALSHPIPVLYVTELINLASGEKEEADFKGHFVDPSPLISRIFSGR